MPLMRRESPPTNWPGDVFRRLFDMNWPDSGWLRIEHFREGDDLVVKAELPGIDPEKDVEITVTGGVLQVRAERQEKTETTKKDRYHSEFRYGSFERDIPLPEGVDPASVKATYVDGILTVRVPVPPHKEETHRVIPVATKH